MSVSLTAAALPVRAGTEPDAMAAGLSALNAGKAHVAETYFRKAVHQDPSSVEAYRNLALALIKLQDYEGALDALDQAGKLAPRNTEVHVKMAQIYELSSDYQDAVKECTRAIELAPGTIEYYADRGMAELNGGIYRYALEDFDHVLKAKADPAVLYARARLLSKFSRDAAAIADLNQAIKLNPKLADAYLLRSTLLRNSGNNELAADDMKMFNELQKEATAHNAGLKR